MTVTKTLTEARRQNFMVPRIRKRVLRSLHLYLEGFTWPQIAAQGGYNWRQFSWKMSEYPDLAKAYAEARRSSAHSFEDKALGLAEDLTGPNEFSGTQVQAHKAAMEQYRWSASRRNPSEYAEAGAKSVSLVVPIQINSSLDLAESGERSAAPAASIWEVRTEVLEAHESAPQSGSEEVEVETVPEEAETALVPAPDPLEAIGERLGLPVLVPSAAPRRPSPGRPRKGHKSAVGTGASRGSYARMKKSASVRAALGLEEDTANVTPVDAGDKPSGAGE